MKKDPLSQPTPFKLNTEMIIDHDSYLFDLDHDGVEEFIVLGNKNYLPGAPARIHIRDSNFGLISQVNFKGKLQNPFSIDWTGDGIDEILIPYNRNDSVFVKILNRAGDLLKNSPLIAATSFKGRNSEYQWYGFIKDLFWEDLDGDLENEFIIFFSEGYSRAPRGVFVFEGQTLQLRWKFECGPSIKSKTILFDFNGDGFKEILFPTAAPGNGYQINGTNDEHSYLFLLSHQGKLLKRREFGTIFSEVRIVHINLDEEGEKEVIIFFGDVTQSKPNQRFEIINPLTLQAIKSRKINELKIDWSIVQTDRNVDKELFVTNQDGAMFLLDKEFNVKKIKKYPFVSSANFSCPDLDNDGLDEIIICLANGMMILDNNLNIKAATQKELTFNSNKVQIYHPRKSNPLILLSSDSQWELLSLNRNPYYLISKYGPIVLILIFLLSIIAVVLFIIRILNKNRYRKISFEKTLALLPFPALVIDSYSRLIYVNVIGKDLLHLNRLKIPVKLFKLSNMETDVIRFLRSLNNSEILHKEKEIQLEDKSVIKIVAEPLIETSRKRAHWLVTIPGNSIHSNLNQAQAWAAMAQRIAHDINNPLTTIQLNLQRLQMEYREQNTEAAKNYDRYTDKIIERIEYLRRVSRQFMKFVNLEKINPQRTDFNQFIKNLFDQYIITLPKDVHLVLKLSHDIPITYLDQELAQSLFANLVSNAVNAMPEGGTLTISTSLAPNLQIRRDISEVNDYIIIEIMDTGIGIPNEMKSKLFQPFVSNRAGGTGLGLMIVKKIVDDHRGIIEVSSEITVGTSFIIYLPVA